MAGDLCVLALLPPQAGGRAVTGEELKRLRTRAKLTQPELAARADVAVRTVIRWEMGQVPIPALVARGLKSLFDEMRKERDK